MTNLQWNLRHIANKSIESKELQQLRVIYDLLLTMCPLWGYILCVSDFVFVRGNLDQILKSVNQYKDL